MDKCITILKGYQENLTTSTHEDKDYYHFVSSYFEGHIMVWLRFGQWQAKEIVSFVP